MTYFIDFRIVSILLAATASAFCPMSPLNAEEEKPSLDPMVVDFRHEDQKEQKIRKDLLQAGLGDRLVIAVKNLQSLLEASKAGNKPIVLYMDDIPMKGIPADPINTNTGTLTFQLTRCQENSSAWRRLLGRPDQFVRPTSLSVGLDDEYPIPVQGSKRFELIIIRPLGFWFCSALFVGIIAALLLLARNSGMLRFPGPKLEGGRLRPYSLARAQMAFWFVLVVTSYVLIWCITGVLSSLTESVLALIGIGSATALGAAMVDSSKAAKNNVEILKLNQQLNDWNQKVANASTKLAAVTDESTRQIVQNELNQLQASKALVESQIKQKRAEAIGQPSDGFINDILNDQSGISFHRFQMFVWTVVLGIIFIWSVYEKLEMPEFSGTMLALMGISSGTYIGFKFPEKFDTQAGKDP